MVPEIWSITDRIFCHFGPSFTPPPPPKNLKHQKFKKMKKTKNKNKKTKKKNYLEISSFDTSVLKIMIVCYTVPEIWHMTDVIVIFQFGLFFALLLH